MKCGVNLYDSNFKSDISPFPIGVTDSPPIKGRGFLLTADSLPYSFELSATSFPCDLELTPIDLTASIIAVSEGADVAAVYNPEGELRVLSQRSPAQLFHNIPRLSAIGISPDGSILAAVTREQIGIWTQSTQRLNFVCRHLRQIHCRRVSQPRCADQSAVDALY
jgi:hypothetical protein